MRQEPGQEQRRLRRLGHAIWEAMKEDRRRREVTVGEDVEILLRGDLLLPHKVWRSIRGWYRAAVDHAPPPARITLAWIMAERLELYCALPSPLGENIPIFVTPS